MTVVLALTIVATPFVLSMILQERSGTVARYESQADYGAEGAKNYAMWRLMYGVDPIERRNGVGLNASYYYDTAQECDIRLTDAYLTKKARVSDPKGPIWGLTVQDEQGKINVRSAPQATLDRFRALVDGRVVSHKDYLTQYSGRDATWACPQRIRGLGQHLPAQNNISQPGVYLDHAELFGVNSKVRATKPGAQPFEATVQANYLLGTSSNGLITNPGIPTTFADGILEVEYRHPVNVNTANVETLVALFEGLHFWLNGTIVPGSQVDHGSAVRLAQNLHGRQFRRIEDFMEALASSGLAPGQILAVGTNAVCPSFAYLDGTGTLPLCFKSYDVYTIEALASMNSPAGTQVAGRGFREVVSVSPPTPLTRWVESQLDFDLMHFPFAVDPNVPHITAYPYGNRVISWPNMLAGNIPATPRQQTKAPQPSDVSLKPQQKGGPGGNEAYVQLATARDYRGSSHDVYQQALAAQWPGGDPREHFDDTQDGKPLQGATQTYPWGRVFLTEPPGAPQLPSIASGGMEVWVRFDQITNPMVIFDVREKDTTNRLTLRVENGEIIFTAADGTQGSRLDPVEIDNGTAEVRQPFTPVQETWYHFGAYWKGTRWAGLALLVDGFAHPQQLFKHHNSAGGVLSTRLTAQLSQTATSITLQDTGFLPNYATPLLIGSEIVLYDNSSGTVVRGARGTQPIAHPAQAPVTLWGYSSSLRTGQVQADFGGGVLVTFPYDKITTGGGTLSYNFGLNPQATVAGDKVDPNPPNLHYIDPNQNQIGVITPNIMDFPDQGYITVGPEVVFYTGRSVGGLGGMPPGTAKFTGCQRGQHGTPAQRHNSGVAIHMWSVPTSNYNNYLSPTIIQVGHEWFGPVQKDLGHPGFWISMMNGTSPLALRRGAVVFGSIQAAHSAGDMVIPTWLARESDPNQGRLNMGPGDRITLVDPNNLRECQRIQMTGPPPPNAQGVPWGGPYSIQGAGGNAQIAAFDNQVARVHPTNLPLARVLKFPSGELLGLNYVDTDNPTFTIGPLQGTIDEIKVFAGSLFPNHLAAQLTAGVTSLQIDNTANSTGYGGLLKIGNEYIGYGLVSGANTITELKRGWLSSPDEVHDQGNEVFLIPWVPVSTLQNDLTPTEANVALRQALPGAPHNRYSRGYVLIDQELILFEWNGGNGLNLGMPFQWDGNTGLYRGMFGTQPASHTAQGSLVYGLPYRFYDTYKARQFDNTMAYYQWSTKMDLAKWHSFWWDSSVPQGDKNIVIHALVRMDGRGEWYDPPAVNDTHLLWEFHTPDAQNPLNRIGHENDAGQLDCRFYVEYRPGSFDSTQPWTTPSWKRTPKLKEIRVEYDRPCQTLYHEDR
jgi:hypothetical protein